MQQLLTLSPAVLFGMDFMPGWLLTLSLSCKAYYSALGLLTHGCQEGNVLDGRCLMLNCQTGFCAGPGTGSGAGPPKPPHVNHLPNTEDTLQTSELQFRPDTPVKSCEG